MLLYLVTFTPQHRRQHCPNIFFKNLKEFDLFSKNNFQQPTGHGVFLEQFGRPWIRGSVLSFVPQKTLFITSASALMSLSSLSLVPVHLSLELFTSLHFSTVACPTPNPPLICSFILSPSLFSSSFGHPS